MPGRGRKVADIYAELQLDKDALRRAMSSAGSEMGADADRMGRQLGDRMTSGVAQRVEAMSDKVVKARREESKAADAVKLAEVRLTEAREKGNQKGSALLALEQKLAQARLRLVDAENAAARATSQHTEAQRQLGQAMADDIENLGKKIGPGAQRVGDDAGSKLALGMRMSIVRNRPLIAAGIGAALAAGAPVALAGATAMFAGIGIVAAAQSDKVKSAWVGTWGSIKAGAVADARVIEPVLVQMAGNVSGAFERMRPALRNIFADVAPQIDTFSRGIIGLAENALPGFERAIARGMPVTQGLADFLEKVGTGLTGFLDRLSSRAPAVGAVFSQLGDTFGTLLPLLGELLGQGAELAATVLPLLNGALGATLGVVTSLGSALPAVLGYFAGMKVLGLVGGWAATAGAALGKLGARDIPLVSTAAGKMGGALSTAGAAAAAGGPVVGTLAVALGLLTAAQAQSQDRIRNWTAALNEGGDAARKARAEMAQSDAAVREASKGWMGFVTSMTVAGVGLQQKRQETNAAAQASREYLASLTPLETAERNLGIREKELAIAIRDTGASSGTTAEAALRYKQAQDEAKSAAEGLQQAVSGVTQSMIDQANQALAAADSEYRYRGALESVDDNIRSLTEAQKSYGASSEEASDAVFTLEGSIRSAAQAAGQMAADSLPASATELERNKASANAYLAELLRLRDEMGAAFPAALNSTIDNLQRAGAQLNAVSGQAAGATGQMQVLGAQRPVPVAFLNAAPLNGTTQTTFNLLAVLGAQRPTPVASLVDYSSARAQYIIDTLARIQSKTVTVTVNTINNQVAFRQLGGASGGPVSLYAGQGFAEGGSFGRAPNGRLWGPGGPLDDLIPAVTETGARLRVASNEWIINGRVSALQGAVRMAALNAGKADIILRRPPSTPAAARPVASASGQPASDIRAGGGGGASITINGGLTLQIPGAYNLGNATDKRRLLAEIRDGLQRLDREVAR